MIQERIWFTGKKYDGKNLNDLIEKIMKATGIKEENINYDLDYEYKPGFLEMRGDLFRPTGKGIISGGKLTYSGNCNPSDVYQAITSLGYAIQKTKIQRVGEASNKYVVYNKKINFVDYVPLGDENSFIESDESKLINKTKKNKFTKYYPLGKEYSNYHKNIKENK